jgi:hypothetical protein
MAGGVMKREDRNHANRITLKIYINQIETLDLKPAKTKVRK